ncbi:MAG: hypothetical protein CM1200mP18_00670 [Gammaproteobacteria bacterium]|nr:MAG: hypothetical protein CM1200mP18_00670 [Gammaproteobacteria bacterium]
MPKGFVWLLVLAPEMEPRVVGDLRLKVIQLQCWPEMLTI